MPQNTCFGQRCGLLTIFFIVTCSSLCSSFSAVNATPPGQLVSWGGVFVPVIAPDARFVAVATGNAHTVVVNRDGTVTGWGDSWVRQLAIPVGLSNVVSVTAGFNDTFALRSDGTVVGWGMNSGRYRDLLAGWTSVKSVSMSTLRAIALREDGTVLEWVGSSPGVNAVPKPENLSNVVAVAAGGRHSLALLADGTVVGWGYNFTSQAVAPANVTNVAALAAGERYSMALRMDRTVVGWGTIDFVVSNVVKMAAGPEQATLLLSDGKMVQIGGGGGNASIVENTAGVKQISAGEGFQFVLYDDGTLKGFGENGRLQASSPGDFADVLQVASHSDGSFDYEEHFVAVRANGVVFSWGDVPSGSSLAVPTGVESIVAVAAGQFFSLALRKDGSVLGWGNQEDNRLAIPASLTNVTAISARGSHSLAICTNGIVSAWGSDAYGQSNVPADLSNVVAVACGAGHSMALRRDGSVSCWGFNLYKQCLVPLGLSNAVAIAAGNNHSIALRADGTVVAWGDNTLRQTRVPAQLSGVVAINAGADHSVAHLADGSIVAWGSTNGMSFWSESTNRNFLSSSSSSRQLAAIVLPRPHLTSELNSDRYDLRFWGFSGKRYRVEHTAIQPADTWAETVLGPIDGKWGWINVSDANTSFASNRFYRVRTENAE